MRSDDAGTGSASLVIRGATVFDGESWDGPVEVGDGRVLPPGSPHDPDVTVVEAAGRMLVPGLIDAHFHAYGFSLDLLALEQAPMSYVAHHAVRRLGSALGRGFTTVRDVAGGDPGLHRAIAEGLVAAPRYLYTGPALTQTGGHGDPRPAELAGGPCGGHMAEVVDGEEAVRRVVRERFRTGAHAIKLMTSGGVVSPVDPLRVPQYSAGEIRAATDEAGRRGSYVAAHAYSPEAILHSVRNGVRSIEHGNLLDPGAAAEMAQAAAFLVPTLVTYDAMRRRGGELGLAGVSQSKNGEVLAAGVESIAVARRAGVDIGFGTDLMGELEDDQLLEFRIRCEVEDPLEVLRSATAVNARLIGRPDLGTVTPGGTADLVILSGDPRHDPSVLWDPERTVIQGGRLTGRPAGDRGRRASAAAAGTPPAR